MIKYLFMFLFLCSTVLAETKQINVVYGEDNRKDLYQVTSALHLELAKSAAGMISHSAIRPVSDNVVRITGNTLAQRGVCAKERFSDQISAANCSGFLVGKDLLVTAGHCIRSNYDCSRYSWVFDYAIKHPNQKEILVPSSSVYRCKEVIRTVLTSSDMNDYAILRLDREVLDRKPLKVRTSGQPKVGDPLVMIGSPTGIPLKVADGAKVRQLRGTHFVANLDAFGGNSGSAVFNDKTGVVEGILVRGENDYVRDPSGCMTPNVCPDTGCRGEDVTYSTELGLQLETLR